MNVIAPCALTRAGTLDRIPARVIELTPDIARAHVDALWWNYEDLDIQKREGDGHWNWEELAFDYSNSSLLASIAILSVEEYLEGAMTYRLNAKSQLAAGKSCVYIDRLATAPRNRKWICSRPFYAGVGTDLMKWALWESYLNGAGGRISLQSLPTPQTVRFYEQKGFIRTNPNQPTKGLVDYELPIAAAQEWLQQTR